MAFYNRFYQLNDWKRKEILSVENFSTCEASSSFKKADELLSFNENHVQFLVSMAKAGDPSTLKIACAWAAPLSCNDIF